MAQLNSQQLSSTRDRPVSVCSTAHLLSSDELPQGFIPICHSNTHRDNPPGCVQSNGHNPVTQSISAPILDTSSAEQAPRNGHQIGYRTRSALPSYMMAISDHVRQTTQTRSHQQPHRYGDQHTSVCTQTSHGSQPHETGKEPCIRCLSVASSFKCILISLTVIGVCCVTTGISLGALHSLSGTFLYLSIMFLILGIMVVVVVFVCHRCMPRGYEPCHMFLGLGSFSHQRRQIQSSFQRSTWNNPPLWQGYLPPEFLYRRPPPTYLASMQDYQDNLLRSYQTAVSQPCPVFPSTPIGSPPPTYRVHGNVRNAVEIDFSDNDQQSNSRPPIYRSQADSTTSSNRSRAVLPVYSDSNTVQVDLPDQNRASSHVTPHSVTINGERSPIIVSSVQSPSIPPSPQSADSDGVMSRYIQPQMTRLLGLSSSDLSSQSSHSSSNSSRPSQLLPTHVLDPSRLFYVEHNDETNRN